MKLLAHTILYLFLIGLFFAGFATPNTALTQDLGRHLLLGDMIRSDLSVPQTNLFSYTYPDFPFINHHYLSQVIFSIVASTFGRDSLLLVTILCMLASCVILFITAKKQATIFPLTIVSILSLRILFERVDVRPEMFSFLLTAIFVTLLYSYREKPSKWIFLLIPLTLLWTQLHIYYFVGVLLIFLFLIDNYIRDRKKRFTFSNKLLLITFCCSLAVTFINPNGIDGALYPLYVFDNYGYTIEENQTIFLLQSLGFQKHSLPYFQLSVILLFTSYFLTIKKTRPIDWFLALTFAFAASMAVRNFPLFALTCFIPFARSLSNVQKIYISPLLTRFPTPQKNVLSLLAVLLLGSILVWQITTVSKFRGFGIQTKDPYSNATVFFKNNNLRGPLFNNFDIGSYLIYSLYPKERVFVDGRPEAYPKEFLQNVYIPMQSDPTMFAKVSDDYDFNTIFISHTDQTPWAESFLKNIIENPTWSPVYLDDSVLILVKKNSENQSLIETFGMEQDTLTFSKNSSRDFQSLLQKARFANLIQHPRLEKEAYKDILMVDATFCPAIQNLAILLSNENSPEATIYISSYQAHCL